MKKMKRFFAVLMAMAMVLGMSVTAFAASPGEDLKYGTQDDTGKITVKGITPEDGIKVTAYQIVKANYENGSSFSGYTPVYGDATVTIDPTTGDITVNDAQLTALLAVVTGGTEMTPNNAGDSYSADVPVGAYLVSITGAEEKIYSNVVVSAMYKNENGGNAIDEGEVNVVGDGNAWVKIQENPHIDKIITNSDNTNKGNTANIGGQVDYQVTVDIPYYGGDYPVYKVSDTMTRLTFMAEEGITVQVKDGEKFTSLNDTFYDMTPEDVEEIGKTFELNFVKNIDGKNTYTLNDYAGKQLVITYSATLDDDATLNDVENPNTVRLDYTHDSKVAGRDDSEESKTKTYTFDIDGQVAGDITEKVISKIGQEVTSTDKTPLSGAVFTLYTDAETKTVYSNSVFNGIVTSNDKADNNLPITGLAEGTYYLKETKAPEGYSLNTHVFEIKIDANIDESGELLSWTISIDGKVTASFQVDQGTKEVSKEVETVYIPNTKLSSLPSTGGMGTMIFTVVGCLIMIVAAGFYFSGRKKSAAK